MDDKQNGPKQELSRPHPLTKEGFEIVRVWIDAGAPRVTLASGVWPDPAAWGILLTDLARHIANTYELDGTHSAASALHRIRQGLEAEWAAPTEDLYGTYPR